MMARERFNWIDILKIIGIWLVFSGHSSHYWNALFLDFAIFPLFFFCGGLFAGKGIRKSFPEFFLTGLRRLMLPYLIFSLFSAFWHWLLMYVSCKVLLLEVLLGCRDHVPGAALWFLPSLFCAQIIFYWSCRLSDKFGKSETSKLILQCIMIFLVWALSCFVREKMTTVEFFGSNTWCLPWSADWAGMFLPWYFAGHLFFEKINNFHYKDLSSAGRALMVCATLLLTAYTIWIFIDPVVFERIWNCLRLPIAQSRPLTAFFFGELPVFFTLLIFSKMLNKVTVLGNMGKETLWMCCFEDIIVCFCFIIFRFVGYAVPGGYFDKSGSHWSGFIYAAIEILLMYFVLLPIFKKVLARIPQINTKR